MSGTGNVSSFKELFCSPIDYKEVLVSTRYHVFTPICYPNLCVNSFNVSYYIQLDISFILKLKCLSQHINSACKIQLVQTIVNEQGSLALLANISVVE